MHIDIRTHGFPLTAALRDHAARRLRFALARTGEDIRSVTLTLGDVNGPRGGCDKTCHVRIARHNRPVLVIGQTAEDMYAAIDRAADRAGRALAREVGRDNRRLRRPDRNIAAGPDELPLAAVT